MAFYFSWSNWFSATSTAWILFYFCFPSRLGFSVALSDEIRFSVSEPLEPTSEICMYVVEKCKQKSGPPPPRKAYRILSLKKIGNLRNKEEEEEEEAPRCRSPTKFLKQAEYLNLRRTKSSNFSTETTENSSLQRRKSRFRNSTLRERERERERERDFKRIIHTNRKNNKKPLTLTLHVPCLGHFPVRGCLLPFEPNGCWKSRPWGGDQCWWILDKLCQYLSFLVWFLFSFFPLWYFLHFVFLSLLGFFGHLLLFYVLLN